MKIVLIYLIIGFSIQQIYPQIEPEWVVRHVGQYWPDYGHDVATDKSDNIYVTGEKMTQTTSTDIIVLKYNSQGVEQWVRNYDGTGNWSDKPIAITIDENDDIYVLGRSMSNNWNAYEIDYVTIKFNSNGVQQWTKTYNGPGNYTDEPSAMKIDNSGNIVVTGSSYRYYDSNNNFGRTDFATIKYNANGDELWIRRYELQNSRSGATGVTVDKFNNIYVTGSIILDDQSGDYLTLKYDPDGNLIWARIYNGLYSGNDGASFIEVDTNDNVYVTGVSVESQTLETITTIKYNSSGVEQWIKNLQLPPNDTRAIPRSMKVSEDGNIIITGLILTNNILVTLKYNTEGELLWVNTHPGASPGYRHSVKLDSWGNVYVAGNKANDFTTIKYDNNGNEKWIHSYNGPANGVDAATSLSINKNGDVYVTGFSTGLGTGVDITTIKYPGSLSIYKPQLNNKWIAGEVDTIKWNGGEAGQLLQIEFSVDNGNTYEIIDFGIPADSGYYIWEVPDTVLTTKAKIKLTDMVNNQLYIESETFRIKPYVLTRIDANGDYYEYRKNRDQWGFSNIPAHMWPPNWFNQFNYFGIDPYTQQFYPLLAADSVFFKAKRSDHPDWLSWVRTFGISGCYANVDSGIYWRSAVVRWSAAKDTWGGSCFGIAAADALAFSHRSEFTQAFPTFPVFLNPISVISNDGVKFAVNELFTHQFGNPSKANDPVALAKTPNQTLDEIRQMLFEDTAQVKTLTIYNNGGSGGHTILAYGLKQNPVQKNLFYIQVYDNSNPNSNNPITIDTLANGGNGSWSTPDWPGWGGNGKIHLEIPSIQYLNGATFPVRSISQSAYILPQNVLEINYSNDTQIRIIDNFGNVNGYVNNMALNEIPGSLPKIIRNGSESPPYGYLLPADNYSVVLDEFANDTVKTFFFTGNKSFVYERYNATQSHTDKLFFDGGVSAVNPDAQTKTVKFLNLINENTEEKLVIVRSIELTQNDSVKIENPESDKVKINSYGSAKNYDIELEYVTENGSRRFEDLNIPLSANTSHTFVPDWANLTNSQLIVLVDIDNNGTIDDTLLLVNQVTGMGEDQGSLLTPDSYYLAQNYPNPFNPSTTISWQSPVGSWQTLKVFDLLGNEVATLVDEYREAGRHEIEFEASNLSSGVYFYQLKAGDFIESKKMIFLR
jgi:hypothetical protein